MPIEDDPHANGRPPDRAASTNVRRLVLNFDRILPDDLDGFVAQRIEILEGLRIAICNRLVKAIELSDAHMLGRITYECNYLSVGGTQIATASLLLRCPNRRPEIGDAWGRTSLLLGLCYEWPCDRRTAGKQNEFASSSCGCPHVCHAG